MMRLRRLTQFCGRLIGGRIMLPEDAAMDRQTIDHVTGAYHREQLVQDGLMTIREAAAFLRLGRSTIYGLMERGELPYARIGARRLIPRRALVDLAASHLRGEIPGLAAGNGPTPSRG